MAVNQGGRATSSDSFCFPAQARKRPKECAATATDGRRGLSSMHPRRMCACDKHESEALNSLSTVGAARRSIVAGCCEFEATLRRPRGLHSSSRLPRYSVTVAFGTLMFLISCSTVPGSLRADASSLGVLPRIPFILFSARWFLLASRGVVSAATAAHLSLQEAWFSSSDSPFASASPSSFSPSAVAKGRAAYDAFQRDAEETRHQGGSRARDVESCWREVLREINLLQSLPSAQACSSLGEASREYIALLRARCIYTRTGRAFPNARQGCYLVPDEIPASWLMPPRADGAGSGDGGETGKAERQQDVEGERRSASGGGGGHAARPRERENGASSEAGATLDPPQRPESYAAEGREGIEGGGDRQAGTAADARREATERRQGAPRLENPCLTLEAFLTLRLEHRAGGFEEALRIQGSGNDEVDAANSSARQQPSPSASFAASVESQGEQAEARRGARHAPAGSGLPGRSRSLPRESEEEAQTDDLHMQASRRLLLALSDTGRGDRNVGEAATLKSLMESCEALRQRVVVGCQHARSMDFGTFALVREQINHIDNICFFLHSAEWQRRSDETVTRLAVASGAVASHLRAQARNLEEMHAIQRQQLEGGWQVTHLLQNLQHGMQDVFAALHQIRSFHRYLADAVGSAQTFFFYLFALLLSLVFTAHVRLQGARLSLFTLLLLLASAEVAARKWGLSALLFLRLKYLQGTDLAAGLIRLLLAGDDNEIQAGRETPFFEKHKRAWDDPSLEDIEAVAFWLRCVYTSAAVAIWLHRALLHKTAEDLLREEMKKLQAEMQGVRQALRQRSTAAALAAETALTCTVKATRDAAGDGAVGLRLPVDTGAPGSNPLQRTYLPAHFGYPQAPGGNALSHPRRPASRGDGDAKACLGGSARLTLHGPPRFAPRVESQRVGGGRDAVPQSSGGVQHVVDELHMRLDKQKVVHARLMGFCERMLPKLRRGEQATEEELREAASLQMLWDQTCGVAAVAAQTPQPATGSAPSNASSGSPSSFYTTPPPPPSFSSASSPTSLSPPHWFSPSSVSCSPPSHVVLPHGTVAPSVLSRGVSGFLASSSSTLPQPAAGAAGRHRSDAHGEETVLFASCRTASYRTAAGSFSPSSFASLPQEEALFESISERSSGPRAQRAGVGEAPTHTSLFLPFFSSFSLSPSSWRTRGGPRPTCSTTLATEEGLGSVAPSEAGGLARSFTSLSSFGGSEGGNICAALSAGTVGSRPRARRDPEAAAATGRPWWSVVRRALGTARPARVPSRPRLTREAVWLSRRYDQDEGEEADASFVPFSSSEEEANDVAGGGRKGERSLKKRASGGESERRSETDTAETPSPQRLAREPRAGSEIEDEAVASRPRLAGRNSLQGRRTGAPAPDGRKEDAKEIGSEKERSGAGKRGGAEAPRTATASRGGPQRNGEAREGREGEETEGRETRRDATDEETAVLHEGRRRRNPSRAARPRGFRNVVELEDPEDFAAACAARLAERRREAQATRKAATAASGSSDPCADASAISSRDPCALPPAACAQGSASVSGRVSLLASFGSPSTCLTLSAQVQGVASSREASPGEAVVPARVESRSRVRRRAKGPAAERQLPVERAEYQGSQRGNAKEQGADRSRGSGATAADPTGETKARGERATASGLSREGELSRRGGEDAARREASAAHAVKEDEDAADKSQAETGRRGVQGDSRARNARGRRFVPCTRFQGGARGPLQRPPSAEELSQLPPLCAPAAPLDGDGEGEESSGDAERGADDCSRAQAEGARQQEEKTEASTEKRRARRTDTAAPRVPRRSPRLQTNPARTAPEEATREQDDHEMFPAAPKACNDRYLKAAPPLAHGPTTSPSQVSTEAEERDAEAHNEKPLNRVTRRS